MAKALAATGRFEESRAALVALLGLLPREATPARIKLTAACANVEHLLGRHCDAQRRLTEALAAVPDRRSPEAVAVMLELGVDAFYMSDYERIASLAGDALAVA